MSLDEEELQNVARDGEMDYTKWPNIIQPLLERMNQIVQNDFPMPRPFPNLSRQTAPSSPTQTRTDSATDPSQSQPTTTPSQPTLSQAPTTPVRPLPPVPLFPNSSNTHVTESAPPSQPTLETLPLPLIQLLQSITSTLRSSFLTRPPHTIQRLAELILNPTNHYKTLPAWLRAVDRVVNVSSTAEIFPLSEQPPLLNGVNGEGGGGILWRNEDQRNGGELGSDESLGGALLTPIPWLRNGHSGEEDDTQEIGNDDSLGSENETSTEGGVTGHGDPLVPEREDGAVTQGELIRMEQEAGVVPVSNTVRPGEMEEPELDAEGDLVPHARGPDIVGAVDMGKVDGKDVEVRIGSPPGSRAEAEAVRDGQQVLEGEERKGKEGIEEDFEMVQKGDEMDVDTDVGKGEAEKRDDDMVLVDADGKMDDEEKVRDVGETKGSEDVQ